MKGFQIIGLIDLAIGLPQLGLPLLLFITGAFGLSEVYRLSDLGASVSLSIGQSAAALLTMMGFVNTVLGLKLVFSNPKSKRHPWVAGLLFPLISLAVSGLLVGIIVLSVIWPIFSLSS